MGEECDRWHKIAGAKTWIRMYQKCSKYRKQAIVAEWDIAGENGGSQESFKRSNDFDEAFIYLFFSCFYFEWDKTKLHNSNLIWYSGIILATIWKISWDKHRERISYCNNSDGRWWLSQSDWWRCRCERQLHSQYSLKLYSIGFDYSCERKKEFKNDSQVFGLSNWNVEL